MLADDIPYFLNCFPSMQRRPFRGLLALVKMLQRLVAAGSGLPFGHDLSLDVQTHRNGDPLIVDTARLTMLLMCIDAQLTQRLQLWGSHSWACVGMADLTLDLADYLFRIILWEEVLHLARIRVVLLLPF